MGSYIEPIPNIPTLAPTNIYQENTQPMRDQLDKIYTDVANVVNDKARSYRYLTTEDITNDVWVQADPQGNPNPVFTKTVALAAPLIAGANVTAHGITDFDTLVNVRAMVTDGTNHRLIPYANPTAANAAGIDVDATNITITVGATFGANYDGYAILQYTKTTT